MTKFSAKAGDELVIKLSQYFMTVPSTFPSRRQLCLFERCAYESFLNVLGCSNIVDSTIGDLAVMSNDLEVSQ